MANAVFTTSESSAYDDQIEDRYHFPSTYLNQVRAALGDLILYYEPRRTTGPTSATGRQAYFAVARVTGIEEDKNLPGHYYARISEFIEFDRPVPFREGEHYFESSLKKEDGSTNKGAFGRAVRNIPLNEFALVVQAGLSTTLEPWEQPTDTAEKTNDQISDDVPEYVPRVIVERIINRKFRDIAFRRHVRNAYNMTCAVTGLRLINGGGRPEVQAAHIRPVEADGPDTIRNGVALTGTAHWLFDRGLLTFGDDYSIILSPHGVPNDLEKIIRKERTLLLPEETAWRPHPTYLKWHRHYRFKP
jgi:putative restriction endonuclease